VDLDTVIAAVAQLVWTGFDSLPRIQTGSGTHLTYYERVTESPSPGEKRLGLEADHSPPSVAEVKNAWSYTSTPAYVFITAGIAQWYSAGLRAGWSGV